MAAGLLARLSWTTASPAPLAFGHNVLHSTAGSWSLNGRACGQAGPAEVHWSVWLLICCPAQVEDVDVDGMPKNANKSKYDLDGGGGQVSLLIRLSHKVCLKHCQKPPDRIGMTRILVAVKLCLTCIRLDRSMPKPATSGFADHAPHPGTDQQVYAHELPGLLAFQVPTLHLGSCSALLAAACLASNTAQPCPE